AQIAAEAILVELVGGGRVPEPATVRADLIGEDDAHLLVFPEAAELHLEIDEADADAGKQTDQKIVDADRQRHDLVDLRRRGPAERGDVFLRYHGVAQTIVLV